MTEITNSTKDHSGLKIVSWLLAVLLFVALTVLSEFIFYDIRTRTEASLDYMTVSERYNAKGGTLEYRAENMSDAEGAVMLKSDPVLINEYTGETSTTYVEMCSRMSIMELDYADYYYNKSGAERFENITREDVINYHPEVARCVDLDLFIASVNEYYQFDRDNAFRIPLRQLFFVIPFAIIGILLYLFLDRRSRLYRVIGAPYLLAILWVGIHYLVELGVALYKIAPQYGPYIILGAIIILLSFGIWLLMYFLKRRQNKPQKQAQK